VEIRPWRCGDEALALAAEPYLSMRSLNQRFLAGTGGRLPASYLRHVAGGPRPTWDAQVAVGPGHLIGWAEFGRYSPGSDEGDLAVMVADPWHRQGIATALIQAMLPRMTAAGLHTLHADMLPGNAAAFGLLTSLFGRLTGAVTDGVAHFDMTLTAALPCPPEVVPCPPAWLPALAPA
jgi:GNAT superfamily N-acetyltransferase